MLTNNNCSFTDLPLEMQEEILIYCPYETIRSLNKFYYQLRDKMESQHGRLLIITSSMITNYLNSNPKEFILFQIGKDNGGNIYLKYNHFKSTISKIMGKYSLCTNSDHLSNKCTCNSCQVFMKYIKSEYKNYSLISHDIINYLLKRHPLYHTDFFIKSLTITISHYLSKGVNYLQHSQDTQLTNIYMKIINY